MRGSIDHRGRVASILLRPVRMRPCPSFCRAVFRRSGSTRPPDLSLTRQPPGHRWRGGPWMDDGPNPVSGETNSDDPQAPDHFHRRQVQLGQDHPHRAADSGFPVPRLSYRYHQAHGSRHRGGPAGQGQSPAQGRRRRRGDGGRPGSHRPGQGRGLGPTRRPGRLFHGCGPDHHRRLQACRQAEDRGLPGRPLQRTPVPGRPRPGGPGQRLRRSAGRHAGFLPGRHRGAWRISSSAVFSAGRR